MSIRQVILKLTIKKLDLGLTETFLFVNRISKRCLDLLPQEQPPSRAADFSPLPTSSSVEIALCSELSTPSARRVLGIICCCSALFPPTLFFVLDPVFHVFHRFATLWLLPSGAFPVNVTFVLMVLINSRLTKNLIL
jgi:hypothetical protein